jgi:hypothetical protein
MVALSASCLAISFAIREGHLEVKNVEGRFGSYVSISDRHGIIEAHNSRAEADARIAMVRERLAA